MSARLGALVAGTRTSDDPSLATTAPNPWHRTRPTAAGPGPQRNVVDRLPVPPVAVTLTAAAGVLHLLAARAHLEVSTLLAVGLALVGLAQVATVAAARRWPAATSEAIVAIDLAAVGAWAVSRTVGLPLVGTGVEAAGSGDLVAVVLQLAAVLVVSVPDRVAALRTDLAPYALVAGLLAVGVAAPELDHGHAPGEGAVVQLGPGDFDGATAVTDRGGGDAMKALMTGAVRPTVITSDGRVLGSAATGTADHG